MLHAMFCRPILYRTESLFWHTNVVNDPKNGEHSFWTSYLNFSEITMIEYSLNRFNKPITNNEDDNAMHLSENYDEPLYFNITDAHPLIWQTYIDLGKCSFCRACILERCFASFVFSDWKQPCESVS